MRYFAKNFVFPSFVLLMTASAFAAPTTTEILKGTVRLSGCSAAFVALEGYQPTDHALIQTNGHCLGQGSMQGEYPAPGEALYRVPSLGNSRGTLYTGNPQSPTFRLNIRELLYGTMTDTDLGLYTTQETYQEIQEKTGVEPFLVSKDARTWLALGSKIRMTSSYWTNSDVCEFEKKVSTVKEGGWVWGPSLRLTSECKVQHGSSGSPLILEGTNLIIGIINTMYENGTPCEFNNPCEVSPSGEISVGALNQPYGQYVDAVYTCINEKREFDLSVPGCTLPKPNARPDQESAK